MHPETYFGGIRWVDVYNNSGEQVPSFAAMQLETVTFTGGQPVHFIKKPDTDHAQNLLLNGEQAIGIASYGKGTYEGAIALLDTGALPTPGQRVGAKSGQWKLYKDHAGFNVSGDPFGEIAGKRAFVIPETSLQIYVIQLTSPLSPGSSASAVILWLSGGSYVVSTMSAITVYDPPGIFTNESGDRGYAYYDRQAARFHVLNLQC